LDPKGSIGEEGEPGGDGFPHAILQEGVFQLLSSGGLEFSAEELFPEGLGVGVAVREEGPMWD
jgi:hypothetical protein